MAEIIKINSKEELMNLGDVRFNYHDVKIRINDYGIFHLENDIYPKYFKYFESWDAPHSCGNYYEQTKAAYIEYLTNEVSKLQKKIDKLNEKIAEESE